MTQLQTYDGAIEAEIADHLLRFSRALWEAFEVRNNRVRFWRMMFLVLQKEVSAGAEINVSFTESEVATVLGRSARNVSQWRIQLVEQFADHLNERFLEHLRNDTISPETSIHRGKGRPPETRVYKLSSYFEECAKEYVWGIVTLVQRMPIPRTRIEQVLKERGSSIFRKVMKIIEVGYFPAYHNLMNRLVAVAGNKPGVAEAFREHAPYWSILLVAWKQSIQKPNRPLTQLEFEMDVLSALRSINRTEFDTCFALLKKVGILVIEDDDEPRRKEPSYQLNAECGPLLSEYASELLVRRRELSDLLEDEFRVA